MSFTSHAVKRLRELYRVVLLRMRTLEDRLLAGRTTALVPCRVGTLELLEPRLLLSHAVSFDVNTIPMGPSTFPMSVATGDFNGDGAFDLAVADNGASTNSVSILLGNGDGTLGAKTYVNMGSSSFPAKVAAADLNGDGNLDLVISNLFSGEFTVALGNGDCTFLAATGYVTSYVSSDGIAIADFNGDSKPDIAVAGNNGVSVFLNNGSGAFTAKAAFATTSKPYSIAAADLNSDGVMDLVVPNQDHDSVSVFSGNGDGTFAGGASFATGVGPYAVTVADVDGEGNPDLVTANANGVSVLLGNGTGTFGIPKTSLAGTAPESVIALDLDGDGNQDLVTANSGSDDISILLGNGDGTFEAPSNFTVGSDPTDVIPANLDGNLDLVVANENSSSISVLLSSEGPILSTTVAPLSYQTNTDPVAVDTGLTLTDASSATLVGATVTISGNYVPGADALDFVNQHGITGVWSPGMGALMLSGTASVADYQTALRSVTFSNESTVPSLLARTVTFVVDDGTSTSVPAARTITLTCGIVNLLGSTLGAPWTLPSSVWAGAPLAGQVSVVVKNSGNVALRTGQSVDILVEAFDTTTPVNPTILLSALKAQSVSALAANGSVTFTLYVNTAGLPADAYMIQADIIPLNHDAEFASTDYWASQTALGQTKMLTSVAPTRYTLQDLASFNGANGLSPEAGLIMDSSGNLYGTTWGGGADGEGTVFEVANGSGTITTLATFDGTNGSEPNAGLIMDDSGNLYGTTRNGSATGVGTVFEVVNGSGTITTLATFDNTHGAHPQASLIMDGSGNLYGTTLGGGAGSCGTVFEVAHGSGTITTLTSFNGPNGSTPLAGLIMDDDGNLFGTTALGGANDSGIVFEWQVSSGTIVTLATFDSTNGASPSCSLIMDSGGNLFGTTSWGGAGNVGTVFEVASGSGTITTLASFDSVNGETPDGGLIMDGVGNLYGTTSEGGANNYGTVFELASGSGTITTLTSFTGINGSNSVAGLIMDAQGNLYGTTSQGGASDEGVVFVVSPGMAPVLTVTAASLSYTTNTPAVAVDSGITINDLDSITLAGATVTISDNFACGEDTLSFINQHGITGSWDAETGILSLSGAASVANYQAALRSITYGDFSTDPSLLTRTISFVVNDGTSDSDPATRTVAMTYGYYVDLAGVFGATWTLPPSVVTGMPLGGAVSVVVENLGNIALPVGQLVNIQLVARDRTTPANPDIILATLTNQSVSALTAGGTATFTLHVNRPVGLPADAYQILATIVPVEALVESQTGNNVVSQTLTGDQMAIPIEQITMTGFAYKQLSQPSVLPGTLVLTNFDHTTTYVEGLDYVVQTNGDFTYVAREPSTSRIYDGQIVHASYSVSAETITSASPFVDLTGQFGPGMVLPPSLVSGDGTQIWVPVVVRNLGNVALPPGQMIFIQINVKNDGGATALMTLPVLCGSLTAGGTASFGMYVTLPASLPAGTYNIQAVVDSTNLVIESNEINNTVTSAGTIDVTQAEVNLTAHFGGGMVLPTSLTSGDSTEFDVPVVVTNVGDQALPATQKVDIQIYGSRDGALTLLYTLASQPVGSLAAGGSVTLTVYGVTFPLGLASGSYNIKAVVYSANEVGGDSNSVTSLGTIAVTQGYWNLTGSTFGTYWTLPASVAAGHALGGYASVLVKNTGNVALQWDQSVTIQVVARDKTNPANPDIELTTLYDQSVSGLPVGGSLRFLANVGCLPSGLPANNYQILVDIIPQNNHGEFPVDNWVSQTATGQTRMVAVSVAPVVTDGADILPYIKGTGAVAVDSGLVVSDAGSPNLAGATVTISGNYVSGQDVLAFVNQSGITGSWNAATGVLTLSGTSSVPNYQVALRSVTYRNTSANPGTLGRTVSFVVDDGTSVSAPAAVAVMVSTHAAFEVWGGNTDYSGDPSKCFSIDKQDYVKLGESDQINGPVDFSGSYAYYIIVSRAAVNIDTVEGDTGYISEVYSDGNTDDDTNMVGVPDATFATVGPSVEFTSSDTYAGYAIVSNPGGAWTGITVYTGIIAPSAEIDVEEKAKFITGAAQPTYSFNFDIEDHGFITSARFQSPLGIWYNLTLDSSSGASDWYYQSPANVISQAAIEAKFGPGEYALQMTTALGTITTYVSFTSDGSSTPIAMPTQRPVFVSLTDGQSGVSTNAVFSWDALTDANANWVKVEGQDSAGRKVFSSDDCESDLVPTDTSYDAGVWGISGANYQSELEFQDQYYGQNADGYSYWVSKTTEADATFRTAGGLAPGLPDLEISNITGTAGTYRPGDVVSISAASSGNIGSGNAFAMSGGDIVPTYVQFRLSKDTTWGNSDDIVIATIPMDSAGKMGGDVDIAEYLHGGIQLPTGIPSGNYYVGVEIDSNNQVSESSKTNNIAWSSARDFVVANGPVAEAAKLAASAGVSGDYLGCSVAISGNTMVVGASNTTVGPNSSQGAAYVFVKSGSTWSQVAELTSSDGAASDTFGNAVAIDGNTIVVGKGGYMGMGGGVVYLFVQPGGGWHDMTQTAELTPSDDPAGGCFGSSVAISGNTVVVAKDAEDYLGTGGAAYIFVKPGSVWSNMTETVKLTSPEGDLEDGFGGSVAVTGNTIVVGASNATADGALYQGAAYVFVDSGPGWSLVAKLIAADGASFDKFGASVAISGNTIVVGDGPSCSEGNSRNAAYVFVKPGSVWSDMTQTAKLTVEGGWYEYFGSSVAISGNMVVVGGGSDMMMMMGMSGACVFVEPLSGWSDMTQAASLTASDGIPGDGFGGAVAVSGDTVVIGAGAATVGGNTYQGAAYTYGGTAPTISGIGSNAGPLTGDTVVTITGTNLSSATSVYFGASPATSFVVLSDTQIEATSPSGAAGTVDVTVTTMDGTSSPSSADQFTYAGIPSVSGISPSQGPLAGGTVVTITGTNLASATSVHFAGTAATSFVVDSDTQIRAWAPAGAAGTVDVTVSTAGGNSATSSADRFTYVAVPTVTGLSPDQSPEAGGTMLTITGTNLAGAIAVKFGTTVSGYFTVISPTEILAMIPAGVAGTVDVTVMTSLGTSATSPADQFMYTSTAPTISSISPNTGSQAGGTTVTITGTNLTNTTAVDFGGTAASSFVVVSDTQITAVSPAGAGMVDVTVETIDGTSAITSTDRFTYAAAPVAPAVTSISPNTGSTAGGTTVTITGSNLSGATVKFGTQAATIVSTTATQIVVTSPAGVGTVDVTVTTASGTSFSSPADRFTYITAPSVTSVSPNTGPTAGGTTVTITGSNLSGATVKFGTQAATIVSATATQIVATSPAGAGTVDVTVITANGTSSVSSGDRFTYIAAPTVTILSPASGPAAGGTHVTITGTNLLGATAVKFGSASATIVSVTATQIVVASPAGVSGAVDVTVVTAGGTSPASPADQFTYLSAPSIVNVGPNAGPPEGGTTVAITGTDLLGATSVKFGTASATIVSVTATQIVVTSPAGIAGAVDVTVTTSSGTSSISSADQFTYVAAPVLPTVTSISANKGLLTGGTTVTITGKNLLGATAVKFGVASADIVSDTETQIVVTSPAGAAGIVDVTVVTAAGTSHTSSADKFTYIVSPTVASVGPNTGLLAGGTTVTIKGTNLLGATGVNFGTEAATIVSATATQIVVKSPACESGTVDVTVQMAGGTSFTSSADQFTYVVGPSVMAISPASGPLAGGTMVTITGRDLLGASAVKFGAKAGTIVLDTGTQIVVKSPAGVAGAVDVTVTTGGGTSSSTSADRFTYVAAPTVAGLSPNRGPLAGGTSVTITGTNLATATAVNFGAAEATIVSVTDTQIVATSPAGDVGAVDVKVVTAGGTSAVSLGDKFTYFGVRRVAVKSVSPSTGSLAGGTTVTIKGTKLLGATAVNFGTALATIVSDTATQIVAISPAGDPGTVDITVTTADGTSFTSSVDQFTYGGSPTVTAVSPGSGPRAAGTMVTITGANLLGATAVKFGTALATIVMDTDTEMLVKTPAGAAGTVDVTVAVGGATSSTSLADQFTYIAAPTVARVTANSSPLAGGTTVTITGTNLLGATAVNFGPASATILSNTDTQIVVTNPAGAAGAVDVRVLTAGGISGASGNDRFSYVAVPTYPTGVLSVSYLAQTNAQYNGVNYSDSQFASAYSQLPLASSLRYGDAVSGQCGVGVARGFYDSAGKIHYTLESMGVNNGGGSLASGNGQILLTQQNVISSAVASKPNGASINASGTMTLTGSWEASRANSSLDVGSLESSLELTLNLLRPNMPSSTIFDGSIMLAHQTSGGNWVSAQLVGQMADIASVRNAVAAGFWTNAAHTDAHISLAGVQIPYKLPVNVGEAFTIQVIMKTSANVPSGLNGGAEVAMGQPLEPLYYSV